MKTADELKRDWGSIKSIRIPKVEKVPKVLQIRGGIRQIETAACQSMSFPFSEVQGARELLIEVDEWLKGAGHPQETGA